MKLIAGYVFALVLLLGVVLAFGVEWDRSQGDDEDHGYGHC